MVRHLALYQILAMARYETLMMWRRGSLRIIFGMLIVLPLLYLLAARDTFLTSIEVNNVPEASIYYLSTSMMILSTIALLATILVAIPIILTEVIPFDRQYRVLDCLRALPLTYRTYLLGKVAGTWLGLLLVMALACIVIGLAGLLLIGGFDLGLWLTIWLSGLLLFTLFAGTFSVLLAAGQPNRRRAVMVGLLAVTVMVALYFRSSIGLFYILILSTEYAVAVTNHTPAPLPPIMTLDTIAVGVGILLMIGLLAWGTLRGQENR